MSLPDTTVELHQHNVVGLGRQATILQPGRLSHMGGSLEMPLHSPRWLYYSLGREVVNPYLMTVNHAYNGNSAYIKVAQGLGLIEAIAPGQTYMDIADDQNWGGDAAVDLAYGDYILVKDATKVSTVQYKQPDEGSTDWWPGTNNSGSSLASDAHHFESTESSEIRRVVSKVGINGGVRIFFDEPFHFPHDTSDLLYLYR